MWGEEREGWAVSTKCAILYRFIPGIKLGIEGRRKRKKKKKGKGKEKRAQFFRGKKGRKKRKRPAKSEEEGINQHK